MTKKIYILVILSKLNISSLDLPFSVSHPYHFLNSRSLLTKMLYGLLIWNHKLSSSSASSERSTALELFSSGLRLELVMLL